MLLKIAGTRPSPCLHTIRIVAWAQGNGGRRAFDFFGVATETRMIYDGIAARDKEVRSASIINLQSFFYFINTMAPIIGPILHTALAAVSWAKGRLDLFAIGDDHGMYHKSYSGTGWSPASGPW